jgi:hypothetical protein
MDTPIAEATESLNTAMGEVYQAIDYFKGA